MANSKSNASKNAQAAARVRAAQQQKRQRMQWSIGIVVLVVVGIVVLVLAKSSKSGTSNETSTKPTPAPASVVKDLAAVPLPAIAAAAKATPSQNPVQPTGDKVVKKVDGKPQVLYIGAEFCPYCAGERWALVSALSKFGTFKDLEVMHSSESNVPTLSFVGSSYTSQYVHFRPIELQDQEHKSLQKATDSELERFQRLGGSSFPFIDFGGTSFQKGGSVSVELLVGKTQTEIASKLASSTTKDTSATSLQGNVNSVTGEFIRTICALTDGKPGNVCKAFPTA